MKRTGVPTAAFVDPTGANADEVEDLAGAILDRLYAQMTAASSRSPLPSDRQIPAAEIPETPRETSELLSQIDMVVQGSMNPAHPGYIGHMDTIPTTISALGDLVASTVNNNILSAEMSPVFSELETRLVEEIASEFGFGPDSGGVLTSGGSLANLHALTVARNHAFDVHEGGLSGTDHSPVVLASEVAHTSLQKAAMLLGLGADSIVPVETDGNSRMHPAALDAAIVEAKQRGRTPFCVVATAGTTTTGNVDPLRPIGEIAEEHGLWYHVDAAYGGALAFSERERHRIRGIETADSITFNPQKWCYVAKTCAMALFADVTVLREHFRVGAPYMRGEEENLGELSVQGTRRADVLKLWLTFQHLGRAGLQQLIDESYLLTNVARELIEAHPALELASEPETNILCFRAVPESYSADETDELNALIQRRLLEDYDVFVSLPTYRGGRWLRIVLLNPFTDETVVDRLFEGIDDVLDSRR